MVASDSFMLPMQAVVLTKEMVKKYISNFNTDGFLEVHNRHIRYKDKNSTQSCFVSLLYYFYKQNFYPTYS